MQYTNIPEKNLIQTVGEHTIKTKYGNITIPDKFKSDGASIPWIFHIFWCPFEPSHLREAVAHDYLWSRYYEGKLTYKQSNVAFFELLNIKDSRKARIFYIGVEIGRLFKSLKQ